ncbi:MAG: ATP-binding cassette domain-containing protein [Oscillospiraceae bacterium]
MSELIRTVDLKKYFHTQSGDLHAVDDVNLTINKGETLGVVGESGCGKSTLGRVILNLIPATSGQVFFEGKDILKCSKNEMKKLRTDLQIIFQDPYASLNPRMTVSDIIAEPMLVNKTFPTQNEIYAHVGKMMNTVGLAQRLANAYPHELDGGRRQRIGVARALALNPKFVVCDEPVSALDVSIQAQILNLLMDLQDEFGFTYLFITHDLSVVKHISNTIAVMYLGQCVERATATELFLNPLHPYTKALMAAVPVPTLAQRGKPKTLIRGEITSPINPKPGCRFAARCEYCQPECTGTAIPLVEVAAEHFVACTRCRAEK